jgi:hypothetical protein
MQDQPLLTLTTENYPSLEFIHEVPARGAPRRLEFCEETCNGGTARRIYRPMMCAADLIAFLETDFANRGAAIWSAADAAAPSAQTCNSALGGETGAHPASDALALGPAPLRSAGAARGPPLNPAAETAERAAQRATLKPVAATGGEPDGTPLAPSSQAQSAQLRSTRKILSDLHERVQALTQARAGEFDSAKRRRLLLHETQFLVRNALVDAFATLLEGLEELDS